MKSFKGKAIYRPKGAAGEYSYWACNFFVGCSNGCEYCYCKKGILSGTMGQDKPQLKKCFLGSEEYALFCFKSELNKNLAELQKHGLFFSFTTDPMLPETIDLTLSAAFLCEQNNIPVKILTKRADWFNDFAKYFYGREYYYAFGFTLTGHDELEPGASTNAERIEAMRKLHVGFRTFASLEPVINFADTLSIIEKTNGFCDLYKIGLLSGSKHNQKAIQDFIQQAINMIHPESKIYFKDSLLAQANINRSDLPSCCVTRDYSLHKI